MGKDFCNFLKFKQIFECLFFRQVVAGADFIGFILTILWFSTGFSTFFVVNVNGWRCRVETGVEIVDAGALNRPVFGWESLLQWRFFGSCGR